MWSSGVCIHVGTKSAKALLCPNFQRFSGFIFSFFFKLAVLQYSFQSGAETIFYLYVCSHTIYTWWLKCLPPLRQVPGLNLTMGYILNNFNREALESNALVTLSNFNLKALTLLEFQIVPVRGFHGFFSSASEFQTST